MALSGLDIYKLLPKTNCRECGFATCLAFAMQLAKKAVSLEKCPTVSEQAKSALEASSQPPIKLITLGSGPDALEVGNETVLFRHEEKFHHACGLGFIIDDGLDDARIKSKLEEINALRFERVGQNLNVNLVAVRQQGSSGRFVKVVEFVAKNSPLGVVLISDKADALRGALSALAGRLPLVYPATQGIPSPEIVLLAKEAKVPLVVSGKDLSEIANSARELIGAGVTGLVLDTGAKPLKEKLWDLTQIRRLALKKSNRLLGFPVLTVALHDDPYVEAMEAATYISKYASIVLMSNTASWAILALLTLRQNMYTDPQKPLQIEPKLYPVGKVNEKSPLLVTTNFSLSYFTVLSEVEASKVPAYILSVDTQGQSVLTAWASEKFTAEQVTAAMNSSAAANAVSHKNVVIPGYVAVMSGDLEDQSGWKVIVGPKEAAGLPAFLKKI